LTLAHAQSVTLPSAEGPAATLGGTNCGMPEYTEAMRAAEEIGTVLIGFNVSPQGQTRWLRLVRSSGHVRLDDATIRAVGGCKFPPLLIGGTPMPAEIVVPFDWKLDGVAKARVLVTASCRPAFPADRALQEYKGTTHLSVHVTEAGEVSDVRVETTSGRRALDDLAVQAVQKCKGLAAQSKGRPVAGRASVEFAWRGE
jgi:protein TonB